MRRVVLVVPAAVAALLALVAGAGANTSHDGWPKIDGVLLMNKTDSSRPLDARPGHDPFGGRDRRYSCDAIHKRGKCHRRFVAPPRHARARDDRPPRPQRAARRPRQRRDPRGAVGRRHLGRLQALRPADHASTTRSGAAPGATTSTPATAATRSAPAAATTGSRPTSAAGSSTAAPATTCSTSAAARRSTTRSATASGSPTRPSGAEPPAVRASASTAARPPPRASRRGS